MFGVNVWGQGVLQCLGLGSGSAQFGVRVRDAPMFGVTVRECSNVWG